MTIPIELGPRTLSALNAALSQSRAIGPTSLDWPAWVQAIGSVLAILLAIALPMIETRRQRQREHAAQADAARHARRQRLRFVHAVGLQIGNCEDELSFLLDRYHERGASFRSPSHARHYFSQVWQPGLNQVLERLRWIARLPFGEWPDPELAVVYSNCVRALEVNATAQPVEKLFGPFPLPADRMADAPEPTTIRSAKPYFIKAIYRAAFTQFETLRDRDVADAQAFADPAVTMHAEARNKSTVYDRQRSLREAIAMDCSDVSCSHSQ